MIARVLLLVGLTTAGLRAHAACERPYMGTDIVSDLSTSATSLRDMNTEVFEAAAQNLEAGLECMREPMPTLVFASAYRYIGTYYYLQNNTEQATRWLRVALELDPGFYWDVAELDESHPLRGFMAGLRAEGDTGPVLLTGKSLNVPSGSRVLLDGRPLTAPEATLNRPHLLQIVAESDDSVRQVTVIEGNAIPDRYIGELGQVVARDASAGSESTDDGADLFQVTTVKRLRPKAKTPLMLLGGATALGAGGLYLMSNRYNNAFYAASTTADLEEFARKANTMVMLSAATLALGVGVEFAGIRLGMTGSGAMVGGRF